MEKRTSWCPAWALVERFPAGQGKLAVYGRDQWTAPVASGSAAPDAMVICPCTMGTLAAVATGLSDNLIEPTIGPYENYEDQLFGYRAAYESYVLIKDLAWSERLARFAAPCQIIKALRVGEHVQASDISPYNEYVKGFLLDTYQKGVKGGTGQPFDWSLIQGLKLQRNFILAGGLAADNVQEALNAVKPYAVDVNSGVEAGPGKKDHELMRAFIRKVRVCEQN